MRNKLPRDGIATKRFVAAKFVALPRLQLGEYKSENRYPLLTIKT